MKTKTYNSYLDYINSDLNNWLYVELKDFENAKDKKIKVYFCNFLYSRKKDIRINKYLIL